MSREEQARLKDAADLMRITMRPYLAGQAVYQEDLIQIRTAWAGWMQVAGPLAEGDDEAFIAALDTFLSVHEAKELCDALAGAARLLRLAYCPETIGLATAYRC